VSALAADVDVGAVLLDLVGRKAGRGLRVDDRITDGTIERTMDGASTLTFVLDDHDRSLLRSGVFSRQIDLQFDGLWWRLVQVSKQGDTLTLTFEDRIVSQLRGITTPRKAARSKMTRAEFALSIVREVKPVVPFICPDLHVKQKVAIETSTDKLSPAKRKATVSQGLDTGAKLTVRGSPATTEQKQNAQRVLDVASSLSATGRATLALMEAVIVESNIQNLPGGDADSRGILQVRDSTAGPMSIDNRDIEQCCNAFLNRGFTGRGGAIAIAGKNPGLTGGQVAQAVQGSAYPGRYDQQQTEAQQWIAAYGGSWSGGSLSLPGTTTKLPYQFQRGGTDGTVENSWDCLQRLGPQEVNWACFAADGAIYFVSEPTLLKAKPRATLSEFMLGVDGIDFDVDNGKKSSEATVTARAARLGFPPGSVVVLDDSGPADGRWLVRTVTRGIFDAEATLTLKRATEPLPEPAATTTSSAGGAAAGGAAAANLDANVPPEVTQAYAAALAIDAKRYPYVWGGGHAHCGVADQGQGSWGGPTGYDCSGSTCAVLAGGGMGFEQGGPVDVSGTIASSWGQAGEGTFLTVWANAIHVWMEFKVGKGQQHFGTGDWGKGWGGAGFNPNMHPTSGFTPRHWPGT
jgi:hypothetical protein